MTLRDRSGKAAARLIQKFEVRYEYPVYFTRDIFSITNHSLLEALLAREPQRRHRVFVIVERAVAAAFPTPPSNFDAWLSRCTPLTSRSALATEARLRVASRARTIHG